MQRAILLIGSTGSGKSTLGNLLVNPENARKILSPRDMTFKTKKMGGSCTKDPSHHSVCDDPSLEIIDTAGFNDADAAVDADNLIKMLVYLRKVKQILAVIFVHSGRTASQYEETLKYAGRLFTDKIMSKNLIIVYTGIGQDERSIAERSDDWEDQIVNIASTVAGSLSSISQSSCAHVNREMTKIQDDVKTILKLQYRPPAFDIDSLPNHSSNKEWNITIMRRKAILDAARKLEMVDVTKLRFAKLPEMIIIDNTKSKELQARADVLQEKIKVSSDQDKILLSHIKALNNDIARYESNEANMQKDLDEYDTREKVVTGDGFRDYRFSVGESFIHAISTYDMIDGMEGYQVFVTDPEDNWEEVERSRKSVTIKMTPSTGIGRTGGSIKCYSYKCVKYAEFVAKLKSNLKEVRSVLNNKKDQARNMKAQSENIRKQYEAGIQNELNDISKKRAVFDSTDMSLDDALNGNFLKLLKNEIVKRKQ